VNAQPPTMVHHIFRLFLPFAAGYYLSYLFRTINAVISPDLVRDIGIDAAGLGLLTGVYLLTFAAFQIPLGVLLDRYGSRATESLLLLFAALGAIIFGLAETVNGLIVGRALIGLGVSGCLMAAFKAFVEWLPRQYLPAANGVMFAVGGLGAMSATTPVEAALAVTDWRGVFFWLAALTLVAAAIIALVVPAQKPNQDRSGGSLVQITRGFATIVRHPRFIRVAPFCVLTQGVSIGLLSLWSGPWLRDVGGLSRADAADGLFLIYFTLAVGYLSMGWIAAGAHRFGVRPENIAISGMVMFLCAQGAVILNLGSWPVALWIGLAAVASAGSLVYAALTGVFPPALAGRVNTALNLLVFVIAFAAQWGVGLVINMWPASPTGQYAAEGYSTAFAILLGVEATGLLWLWLMPYIWRPSIESPDQV